MTYAYNAQNCLYTVTAPDGRVMRYIYVDDSMTGMTYPSGRTVAYSFDALGRVAGITTTKDGDTKTVVSSVAYQPFGGVKSFTYGNGQTYTRQYDQDGRIAAYTLGATQYNLGFDAASRIGFIAENGNAANTNNYGYDALDRLTEATLPASSFGYGYDAVGNRVTRTAGAQHRHLRLRRGEQSRGEHHPASGPARSFTFDANGSTTADGTNQYAYDTRGRLIQATTSLGPANYQVNALGQRVQKAAPGTDGPVTTIFQYDTRGRLIAESNPDGTVTREYIYLNELPVGVIQ